MEQQLLSLVAALLLAFGCASQQGAEEVPKTPAPASVEPAPIEVVRSPSRKRAPALSAPGPGASGNEPPQPGPAAELPKDTLVLHIGDSFAGALGIPLGLRFKAAGLRSVVKFETASYVPGWASGKALPEYLDKYRPQLVLITLGANEIELAEPEQRAGSIKRLISRLDGRPCVWIKPPLWRKDTGIFQVIRDNIAPCRMLDSDTIVRDLPRKRDNIHPSDEGREIWADAVFVWLARERQASEGRPWNLRPEP